MTGCFSCNKSQIQHFKPRLQKKVIPSEQECSICGVVSWEVQYCGFCKEWLCTRCRDDPIARFKAMMKKKVLKKKLH